MAFTRQQTTSAGIGLLAALGLQYILGRLGLGNFSFYIIVFLAAYLIFFSKK